MSIPPKRLSRAVLLGAAVNVLVACDEPATTTASSEPKSSTQTMKPKPAPSPAASASTVPSATTTAAPPAKDDFAKMSPLSDEQIVATLIALNQGEVDQAGVAVKTAKDERVKK